MAKVIAICGKICCGKTYYSNTIKNKENAIILSCDEVTRIIFDNNLGDKHDEYTQKIKDYLLKKSIDIVTAGCNVILDWGFWSKNDRNYIKDYYKSKNIVCEMHYINVTDNAWNKNIEEEIKRTEEPKRDSFETEEEYNNAFQDWLDSLKLLSQEYMSASWGVDIENKLATKASNESVSILLQEINNIKGGDNTPSLESLSDSVTLLQDTDELISKRIDEIIIKDGEIESGRLVNVESGVSEIKDSLKNYVTLDYIQKPNEDFIFLTKEDYNSDQKNFKSQISQEIETDNVVTNSIQLNDKVIEVVDSDLIYDNTILAKTSDIPKIKILSQVDYEKLENIDESTYYYTFDGSVRLVTESEMDIEIQRLQQQIDILNTSITLLEQRIAKLES